MAKSVLLKAQPRTQLGRNRVKALRAQGSIPAVLYGDKQLQSLEVKAVDLIKALSGSSSEHVLVDLEVEGAKHLALIQDIQHDPLKDKLLHVDFHKINADEKLHSEVPLVEVGEPEGVRTGGGLLEHMLRMLKIECLPKDLPDSIQVDVSALKIGDSIHVGEIKLPEGVVALNPADVVAFAVHAPVVVEETPAAAATTAAAAPEVITAKKPEEEKKAEKK